MLTIRMQRKGRTGHAQFRVVVQDSRFHPTSGRVVAYVGNYDPHTKAATLDGEKISQYLQNGAQPSDRVAKLLTKEGINLPSWFQASAPKNKTVRNADKRRSTRPKGAVVLEPKAEATEEIPAESAETPEAEPAPVVEEESTTKALAKDEVSAGVEAVAELVPEKAAAEPEATAKEIPKA